MHNRRGGKQPLGCAAYACPLVLKREARIKREREGEKKNEKGERILGVFLFEGE